MSTLLRRTTTLACSLTRNLAASSTSQFEITDRQNEKVIQMKLNGDYAIVEYENHGNVYDLIHSFIPEKYQGKGYGKIFAQKTFDYIAQNNLRMKITCEFLMSHYVKNKDKYEKFYVENI